MQPRHLGLAVMLLMKHFSEQSLMSRTMVRILMSVSRKLVVKSRDADEDEISRQAEHGAGGLT
jgi:hypothetical protein